MEGGTGTRVNADECAEVLAALTVDQSPAPSFNGDEIDPRGGEGEGMDELPCTRCGTLCCDYRQTGPERVCLLCIEGERDEARRATRFATAALHEATGRLRALRDAVDTCRQWELGAMVHLCDDCFTGLGDEDWDDVRYTEESGECARCGKDVPALRLVLWPLWDRLSVPRPNEETVRGELCAHPGASGPCMPRAADGRCVWCERELAPAGAWAKDCDDGAPCTDPSPNEVNP